MRYVAVWKEGGESVLDMEAGWVSAITAGPRGQQALRWVREPDVGIRRSLEKF